MAWMPVCPTQLSLGGMDKQPHQHPYPDLLEGATEQDRKRITVLYISRKTRTPDSPGVNHNFAGDRGMQHSQPGNVRMGYMTAGSQHGNKHWTEITRPSTPMRFKGSRRSTQTSSTLSITKQTGSLANTPSRGRKISSNSATSHGKPHFIDGHPNGVAMHAQPVEHGCTKA